MQLDTNAFQSKPPSLEEGPMGYHKNNENYALNRVEKITNCRRCIDIIKVILYLELILFIGWIGCIFLSNNYRNHSYNNNNTPHDQMKLTNDLHKDDSSVNSNSILNDDIVRWNNDAVAIVSTEQSQTTTTPVVTVRNDFVQTETTTSSSKSETEGSDEDITLWEWLENMDIPIIIDDIKSSSIEEKNSNEKSKSDSPKKKKIVTDDLEAIFPTSGLIHVIDDDHVSDMNTGVPFPLPLWHEKYTTDATEIPRVEDDSSSDKSKVESTEKTIFTEDFGTSPAIFPESEITDVIEEYDSNMKNLPFRQLNWNHIFQDHYVEDDSSSDKPQVDSTEKTIFTEDFGSTPAIFPKSEIADVIEEYDSNMKDLPFRLLNWDHIFQDRYVDDDSSNDKPKVDSTEKTTFTEDFGNPSAVFPNSAITDMIKEDDSDMKNVLFPLLHWKHILQEQHVLDDVVDSGEKSLPKDTDPEVLSDDQISQEIRDMFHHKDVELLLGDFDRDYERLWNQDTSPEATSDLKAKRSAESSSSEEKTGENKSTSSASSSSEEKPTKDCSRVSYYNEDGEEITESQTNINFSKDKFIKWNAENPKPDCGGPKAIMAVNGCGELSYICPSSKIENESSEKGTVTESS